MEVLVIHAVSNSRIPEIPIRPIPADHPEDSPAMARLFHENPQLPSLNLELLAASTLFSIRVDQKYRAILSRQGPEWRFLHVAMHDEAYRWAETHAPSLGSTGVQVRTDQPFPSPTPEPPEPEARFDAEGAMDRPSEQSDKLWLGRIYRWSDLKNRLQWDADQQGGYYLLEKNGSIVCACLHEDKNPNAPEEIVVSRGPIQTRKAEMLARQSEPIPVFIQKAVDQWEYWGDYRFDRFEHELGRVHDRVPENRKQDAGRIMYMTPVG
ncbi:MAG: hypothetical protein IPJ98_08130 [Bryobacterales bacterium]|nr:hypothetical protein [Bryobacterales bacterium]